MLKELASSLGITEIPESWEQNWEYAAACLPVEISFLKETHLNHVRNRVILSEANAQIIMGVMELIRHNEALRRLAWLWHCILYRLSDPVRGLSSWPVPTFHSPDQNMLESVFPAVVLLSGYERLEEMYRERNIPEHVVLETLSAVEVCMNLYEEYNGRPGLGMRYLNWLQHCFNARIYKLGRLEFELRTFAGPIRVYRNVRDGSVVALSTEGLKYRGDGLIDGTNDIFDEMAGWVATLDETEHAVAGFPVHPDGYAVKDRVTLSTEEWQLALSPGDPVISVHIPRAGRFTYEACRDSFLQATEFFATYYADRPYAAFMCVSWLLDPQLQLLLDPSSNLVQFQKWYDLYPVKSNDDALFSFVFMCERCGVDQLPEQTSLQRKMKQFMQAGGHLHAAGGFILPEQLKAQVEEERPGG